MACSVIYSQLRTGFHSTRYQKDFQLLILKNVFTYYDALSRNKDAILENIPSYKSYLNYIKQNGKEEAKQFWTKTFKDFESPFLFNKLQSKSENLIENQIQFKDSTKLKAQDLAKSYQVSLNTLFQGIWALILAKYSNSKDIVFGNTVSGRSGNFPNIELITGMFANVLPLRTNIKSNIALKEWFKEIQNQQYEARKYEHNTVSEIVESIDSKPNTLFDSLFIFENFPWDDIDLHNIKISDFKSGITTTYPLTITMVIKDTIDIHLLSDQSIFSTETNFWILNRFEEIINILNINSNNFITNVLEKINQINIVPEKDISKEISKLKTPLAPKKKTELDLLKIWERTLGINQIYVNDNFFEIGGKSLLAIKMFSLINSKFKTKIPATALLEYPTIAKLSDHILLGKKTKGWEYIIPIRSTGNKNPTFCIHGGGGYVIFFNPLVNALHKDIPVYALQPAGLNVENKMHSSIENMALDYAKEIKEVQPNGPYNLLTYCFSPAVGIEIANIFKAEGEKTNLIVIDSIIKQEDFADPERIKMRIYGFLNRIIKNPVSAVKLMAVNNYRRFLEPTIIKLFASESTKKLNKVIRNLFKIYVDYDWNKNHTDDVLLILTKKADKNLNPIYINSWEEITNGKVEVVYTTGRHLELFDSPHVESVAEQIERNIYNI